jgi:hypothetical protein
MSHPRRSRNPLVPLAITVTAAAAAAVGLYYWLGPSNSTTTTATTSSDNVNHSEDRRPQNSQTELSPLAAVNPRNLARGTKRNVAVVVSSSSIALLHSLPHGIDPQVVNLFVLVYCRDGGEVAHKNLLPPGFPEEFVLRYEKEAALVPILRVLTLDCAYIEVGLIGREASVVSGLLDGGWINTVIVVEDGTEGGMEEWRTGVKRHGKRCRILEGVEVGGDWNQRVGR